MRTPAKIDEYGAKCADLESLPTEIRGHVIGTRYIPSADEYEVVLSQEYRIEELQKRLEGT